MYRTLDSRLIVSTAEALARRIGERFPDSGLSRISQELLGVAVESEGRLERLRTPILPLRIGVAVALAAALAIGAAAMIAIRVRSDEPRLSELLQGLEAAVNDVIFLGIAVYFLLTIETRIKRRQALRALHELRSIAHIIDMHQLTKDPEHVLSPPRPTASSPARRMSRFDLARYLDYCSELLSITSKLAALHVQNFNDPVVLNAVDDIESLTQGLSGKIWDKIMILDLIGAHAETTA